MQDAKIPSLLLFSGHGVPEIVQYYTLVGTAWMEEHTGKQLRKARDAELRGRLDGHISICINLKLLLLTDSHTRLELSRDVAAIDRKF